MVDTTAVIFNDGKFQGVDNSGNVVSYGKLYFSDAISGNQVDTFTTSTMETKNPYPIILSASGKADVYTTNGTFNVTLKNKDDVTIWTINNFIAAGGDGGIAPIYTSVKREDITGIVGSSVILEETPTSGINVHKNGLLLNEDEYSLDSKTIVFVVPLIITDEIVVEYGYIITGENESLLFGIESAEDLLGVSVNSVVTVNVKGYFEKNDGGGGIFNYDTTLDKSTADGGLIIDPDQTLENQGDGVGEGCWRRQYSGAINIQWFGAMPSEDSTTAIQAALDAEDTIFVPEGRFNIATTLYMNPQNRIMGIGGGGYTSNASKSWIGITSDFTGDSMIEVKDIFDSSGERRVEISDIFLFGWNVEYLVKNIIKITGYSSGRISNVTASNGIEYGIKLENYSGIKNSGNMTVENCYVRMPNSEYISDPEAFPIYAAYYCEGLYNVFTNCLSDGGFNGMVTDGGALGGFNTISNCHPEGWFNAGIVINDTNGKNQILDCDIVATKIAADDGIENSFGIHVSGVACYDNIISNNQIHNLNGAGPYAADSAGIYIPTNVQTVSGNKIINFEYGIRIAGSINMLSNNSINNVTTGVTIESGTGNKIANTFIEYDEGVGYAVDNIADSVTNKCILNSTTSNTPEYNNIYPLDAPIVASVYQDTPQVFGNIVETKVIFDAESIDTTDSFTIGGSSTYNSPISGYFQVNANLEFTSSPSVITLAARVNGTFKRRLAYGGATQGVSGSAVVYLEKGDALTIYGLVTGTPTTKEGEGYTAVDISLLSQEE